MSIINHYSGNLLHAAHRQDLVIDAKGGWLLKQASENRSPSGQPGMIRRLLLIVLISAVLIVGVLSFARVPHCAGVAPSVQSYNVMADF